MTPQYKRNDGSFVGIVNGRPYHVQPGDPLFDGVDIAALPLEPGIMPVTAEDALSAWRGAASIERGQLCLALYSAGLISASSTLQAARGSWPVEFAGVLSGMTAWQSLEARIAWADASVVHYNNPLIQSAVMTSCGGKAADAQSLLDKIFGGGAA